ncbi:MAG TPA: PilZ domain-containing protein [Acidimicrobiales bacterium]
MPWSLDMDRPTQQTAARHRAHAVMQTRRRYPRVNLHGVEIDLELRMAGQELVDRARALDISVGGVRIAATRRLTIGDLVVLRGRLPGSPPHPIHLAGTVVWCHRPLDPDGSAGAFNYGIEYLAVAESTARALSTWISQQEAATP